MATPQYPRFPDETELLAEIAAMTPEELFTYSAAAGWWSGCVAACRRWSNHPQDRCQRTCQTMLEDDVATKTTHVRKGRPGTPR
jgi:hypothetical protein